MNSRKLQNIKNYPNFHISGLDDNNIIDLQNGGLDDIEEFNCSMHNFGETDNLPDSDKAMISGKNMCKYYRRY